MLFKETIDGHGTWSRIFRRPEVFAPLVAEMLRRGGFPEGGPLRPLTPGTNAVFRVGGVVVKVFAPKEARVGPEDDYRTERAMLAYAARTAIPAPRLLASGEMADRYLFRYLVMTYAEGVEARDWLSAAPREKRPDFARRLGDILRRLNRPLPGPLPETDLVARALSNPRLNALPQELARDMRRRAKAVSLADRVIVHGDLTGENVLVSGDGALTIIDFADSVAAPRCYEWVPIFFELFRCDAELMAALTGKLAPGELAEALADGLSLHDFGGDILRDFAKRSRVRLEDAPGLLSLVRLAIERGAACPARTIDPRL